MSPIPASLLPAETQLSLKQACAIIVGAVSGAACTVGILTYCWGTQLDLAGGFVLPLLAGTCVLAGMVIGGTIARETCLMVAKLMRRISRNRE